MSCINVSLLPLLVALLATSCSTLRTPVEISGQVYAVQPGEKGYAATIKAQDGTVYHSTVSEKAMDGDASFPRLKTGQYVQMKGKITSSGDTTTVAVREIMDATYKTITVSGALESIEALGKEGYSLWLRNAEGKLYKAFFPRDYLNKNNLRIRMDGNQFLKVKGELRNPNNPKRITVVEHSTE